MYFRLGGGTLRGISKPGEIVWSRFYVEDNRLKLDIGRGQAIALPEAETKRRWDATTPQWPIMHAVTYGTSRDQMMAQHKSNHIQVVYATDADTADRAALAKAQLAHDLGVEVNVCGTRKPTRHGRDNRRMPHRRALTPALDVPMIRDPLRRPTVAADGAALAQLDRASVYGTEGWWFEPTRLHFPSTKKGRLFPSIVLGTPSVRQSICVLGPSLKVSICHRECTARQSIGSVANGPSSNSNFTRPGPEPREGLSLRDWEGAERDRRPVLAWAQPRGSPKTRQLLSVDLV